MGLRVTGDQSLPGRKLVRKGNSICQRRDSDGS
jgi:hypothetical protein